MDKLQLFNEITTHLLNDEKPSVYLTNLLNTGKLKKYPFSMLADLKKTQQNLTHHPEGDVWNHTMLVVDNAAQYKSNSKNPKVFMWGALLHDIGKPPTTKLRKGRWTSYDHDRVGFDFGKKFLEEVTDDEEFISNVLPYIRWHMQSLYVNNKLPFQDIPAMLNEISLDEIALLCYCDRMGRTLLDKEKEDNVAKSMETFKRECEKYLMVTK